MTKYFYVAVVAVLVIMAAAFVGDFGHSAGQVIKTWKDQVETTATRQPAPLTTTIIINGKKVK